MSAQITLSAVEYGLVVTALNTLAERYAQYIRDTEALAERPFPTDNPELWRQRHAEIGALYKRLTESP